MIGTYFVDASVFVYDCDPTDPVKHARAGNWLEQLWASGSGVPAPRRCRSSTHRHAQCPKAHGADEAWDCVASLLVWEPQAIDRAVLEGARRLEDRIG